MKRNAIEPEGPAQVPGREVEPLPAVAEGYTWCPECQAAFEGDVCPGCSPGIGIAAQGRNTSGPEPSDELKQGIKNVCLETVIACPVDKLSEEAAQAVLTALQAMARMKEAGPPAEPAVKNLNDLQEAVKVAELDVKIRNTTESLKCTLTDDEKLRYGLAQGRAHAEIIRAEEELQSVKSQYKSRIDAAAATRSDMAQRINNGYEFRQVECVEKWNYSSNLITVVRTDTYETVSRRTMTRDEMQRKLF